MNEDEDNFVTYGDPFDEDDAENSNFLHPKSRPQAYEQRVLNERGRPMRFHGAFTGGFSAGYFNTVGSKEGFRPQSFTSSRRNRSQNAGQQVLSKPEDFMDEEDLGEFGIAPRHYRTRREFDDHHIFDTLSESLGGKSVIPDASDILKRMLIPSGTSLADRLLRRMGWKSDEVAAALTEEEADETSDVTPSKERDYAVISFAPKTNTFGLGYSGLDPEIAWGRRAPTSSQDPRSESVSSLQRREQDSHLGFNPSTGPVRQGIRGQAFGVGALHSEDADIYAQDSLASYDFSIGAGDEHDKDDDEDYEMAELEAARHGRFSDLRKRIKSKSTIDGWTPPTLPKVLLSGVEEEPQTDVLEGFMKPVESEACLVLANAEFFVIPKPVILPPGYNPVFHPECLGGGAESSSEEVSEPLVNTTAISSAPLLKPFVSDSAKQARFEAYQLLLRRGLSHDEAYQQCSSRASELTMETRGFEANVFATLLRNLAPAPSSHAAAPTEAPATDAPKTQEQQRDKRPLTAGILDAEKQRLVANLLKSRFRSAGEMDIRKELTEAQEEERRRDIGALDMTDPRDSAAANESYGVLTRRTLTWHPAALLCKRVNVANPYPDSTFVGCPEDRRFRRPPKRSRRRRDDITSSEFTLFQLLDMNAGGEDDGDMEDDEEEELEEGEEMEQGKEETSLVASTKPPSVPPPSIFDALFAESEKAQQRVTNAEESVPAPPSNAISRVIGPVAPPAPVNALTTNNSGGPSMDLFKSIFASDEELDDEDDVEEVEKEAMPPPPSSLEIRPLMMSPSRDKADANYDNNNSKDGTVEQVPTSPPRPEPAFHDLSVHKLFKHLFNPELDSEAPLFAVSRVTHQRREEKSMEDAKKASSSVGAKPTAEEDFYGPSLPPDFGPAAQSNISISIPNDSSDLSSDSVDFVEWKKLHKEGPEKVEHRSRKHSHKHHHHHHHRHKDKYHRHDTG
ncbi:G patch domain containing 1 [Echinococcus multilocularis]|uniref:G patch domain containing 1 n=1 Tax=Echinococcus multilocularis TaxID=6211 RepID=A0A068YEK9_ECHMU|nr:G patch domain containing 1 [Echinococcus multilocularis]